MARYDAMREQGSDTASAAAGLAGQLAWQLVLSSRWGARAALQPGTKGAGGRAGGRERRIAPVGRVGRTATLRSCCTRWRPQGHSPWIPFAGATTPAVERDLLPEVACPTCVARTGQGGGGSQFSMVGQKWLRAATAGHHAVLLAGQLLPAGNASQSEEAVLLGCLLADWQRDNPARDGVLEQSAAGEAKVKWQLHDPGMAP